MSVQAKLTSATELAWLSEVSEVGPQLTLQSPIAVRPFEITSGSALQHPECHPYCELGMHTSGSGIEYIEREHALRKTGDLFLAGPSVPHNFTVTRYPLKGTAIYFLPSVLCELGPQGDGLHILRRFTAKQGLADRLVTPPPQLRKRFVAGFEAMQAEFTKRPLGYEIRLRTQLMEMLVDLVRWEQKQGRERVGEASPKWDHVNQALHYLRAHFAEPVYARDVAAAIGVSESRLKVLFREALGVPWSRYVQSYRIQQAVALLASTDCNVTQAALAVGFESLSHFNTTFRAFVGMTPSAYLKQQPKTAKI